MGDRGMFMPIPTRTHHHHGVCNGFNPAYLQDHKKFWGEDSGQQLCSPGTFDLPTVWVQLAWLEDSTSSGSRPSPAQQHPHLPLSAVEIILNLTFSFFAPSPSSLPCLLLLSSAQQHTCTQETLSSNTSMACTRTSSPKDRTRERMNRTDVVHL